MFDSTNIRNFLEKIVEFSDRIETELLVGDHIWELVWESAAPHRVSQEETTGMYRVIHYPRGSIKVSFDASLPDNAFELREVK